jgi:hypothetical protein
MFVVRHRRGTGGGDRRQGTGWAAAAVIGLAHKNIALRKNQAFGLIAMLRLVPLGLKVLSQGGKLRLNGQGHLRFERTVRTIISVSRAN